MKNCIRVRPTLCLCHVVFSTTVVLVLYTSGTVHVQYYSNSTIHHTTYRTCTMSVSSCKNSPNLATFPHYFPSDFHHYNYLNLVSALRPRQSIQRFAANHEQEEHDHHGHFIHDNFIIVGTVGKRGTGRLLHLFG